MTDIGSAAPSPSPASAPASSSPAATPSPSPAATPPSGSETGGHDAPSQSENTFVSRQARTVSPPGKTLIEESFRPAISKDIFEGVDVRRSTIVEQPTDIDSPSTEIRRGENVEALLNDDSPALPARPEGMPRSWSNDRINDWLSLTDGARAAVNEREADRDREIRARQNETAAERKRVEAQWAQVQQARQAEAQQVQAARQQYELAINAAISALEPEMAKFSAIRTEEDLKRLHAENPAAAARFIEVGNRAHELLQRGAQLVQQRQAEAYQAQAQQRAQWQQQHQAALAQQQEAHANWVREQDAAIRKAVPELADPDPERVAEFQGRVKRHLKDKLGFSDQEIAHNYANGPLRDARVQRMVLNSLRYEEARRRAASTRPEVGNKPLQPGNSNSSLAPSNLNSIAAAGDMQTYIAARAKGRNR
jgi:hypothetical protein